MLHRGSSGPVWAFLAEVIVPAGVFLIGGAVQMMRLRSYPLAVASTILAMIPGSPACVIGLPFGIWGFIVLRRQGVRAAFLDKRFPAGPSIQPAREPKGPGKMASFFR